MRCKRPMRQPAMLRLRNLFRSFITTRKHSKLSARNDEIVKALISSALMRGHVHKMRAAIEANPNAKPEVIQMAEMTIAQCLAIAEQHEEKLK